MRIHFSCISTNINVHNVIANCSVKKCHELSTLILKKQKNYDFEVADITVKGDMKFTHIEFLCPVCQKYYTVKEIKENDFLIERWK